MVNVIVVFPNLENAKSVRNLLIRNGYSVAGVCTSGAQALQAADRLTDGIIVCGYKFSDMLYTELHECLPPSFEMLLAASDTVLGMGVSRDIVSLPLPLKVHDLVNTLEMMTAAHLRKKRKQKAKPKERSLEDKRIIEKAKQLLMERNHMTEDEAHRYIQKCSMDSGNSMVESAKMVFSLMKF
ncbi:MAG TPA: ANTAR domain-containing protein [Candidatus Limivivens intestinipullorum]|uniref:ANTAR domain-containing protein n=1 Tax=Candidatus Limivivens intestinipullorum TaxID=2840858 RepID=A0A9D1ERM1_9FIRM|nr:ANTAR domain-containing protein [Candidatus Limivivens intestinipullorum]